VMTRGYIVAAATIRSSTERNVVSTEKQKEKGKKRMIDHDGLDF
jgi:hypothetical protein